MPTANKSLSPTLRFPEFRRDGEWAERPLGNISTRIRKKVGTKVLTPVSITAGLGFVDQTAKFGRRIAGEQYKNYIHIKRGDFVYNKGNSKTFAQGCIYQLKEFDEAAASTAFICFKLDDRCVDQYFQSLFEFNAHGQELAKFITSGARSDGLLNINPNDFFSIELPVPPQKAEQQKIADCLGSLDDLIAAHSRKLAALQDHKKGLLQQLFPAEGETTPKLRFSEFEGEWPAVKIGELGKVCMCKRVMKHQTSESGEIPFYKIGTFGRDTDVFITRGLFTDFKKKYSYPKIGDILISAAGTIGRCVVFDGKDAYFQDSNIVWIANTEKLVTNAFLYYCYANVQWTTDDNTIPRLYNENLRNIQIPAPSITEQQKIADCLSALDALITAQTEQIDALKAHKKGLMQRLFPNPGVK